jgi:succinate-semialdehyde dehydrogenase/glutarate-semialdehyde dehydrogenase
MSEQAELDRPVAREKLQTVNPATGEPGKSYDAHTIDDARAAAEAAHHAFREWRRTSFGERGTVVRKAAEILRARKYELAALMTEEMGKTLEDGRAEVEKCAFQCDWFADHAQDYLADEPADIGGGEAFVTFNPLGVVLAVMPWQSAAIEVSCCRSQSTELVRRWVSDSFTRSISPSGKEASVTRALPTFCTLSNAD